MSPKEVSEIEGVDVVLGTRNKGDVVYYVNKAKDEAKTSSSSLKVFLKIRNLKI